MEQNEKIGMRIQALREEKGITQIELAKALNVKNRENIARWELGTRELKVGTIIQIAKYFNVSADYLLGMSDVKSTEQDIKIACEVTGLSEKSIKKFEFIKEIRNGNAFSKETEKEINEKKENIEECTNQLKKLYAQNDGLRERLQLYIDSIPHSTKVYEDDIFDEAFMLYVCINSENDDINFLTKYEKQDAKKYIETINILVESDGFFDFIKHLTIYSITDFQKKPKKIFSVSAEENSDIAHSFIFNSSLIEQGLIAKIQQFIISLKQDNANFYLTDIETCIQEDTENG